MATPDHRGHGAKSGDPAVTSIGEVAPEYVAARTVLLDALQALAPHRLALVVVGAQAVYLRTGSAGLTVAPYTTDGDVALDPSMLGDNPLLEEAMRQHGFRLLERPGGAIEPGTWVGVTEVGGTRFEVPVDLIVPEGVLDGGKTRGARLRMHGKRAAKRTYGLEAALVDQSLMPLSGLAPGDDRCIEIAVAGVAALLVAKVIKIRDRVSDERRPHRQRDKDAGDVLRLVRSTTVSDMAKGLEGLRRHAVAGDVTREALQGLYTLFRAPGSPGVAMAVRAVELDVPKAQVEGQLTGYVRELQRQLDT